MRGVKHTEAVLSSPHSDYIKNIIEAAPPLTPAQQAKLRGLLR